MARKQKQKQEVPPVAPVAETQISAADAEVMYFQTALLRCNVLAALQLPSNVLPGVFAQIPNPDVVSLEEWCRRMGLGRLAVDGPTVSLRPSAATPDGLTREEAEASNENAFAQIAALQAQGAPIKLGEALQVQVDQVKADAGKK